MADTYLLETICLLNYGSVCVSVLRVCLCVSPLLHRAVPLADVAQFSLRNGNGFINGMIVRIIFLFRDLCETDFSPCSFTQIRMHEASRPLMSSHPPVIRCPSRSLASNEADRAAPTTAAAATTPPDTRIHTGRIKHKRSCIDTQSGKWTICHV